MIDIHTHILPGVDDGSEFMDESINMAKTAFESGVDSLVVTPHCNIAGLYENYDLGRLRGLIDDLRGELVKINNPLKIYEGMEIYLTPKVPQMLRENKLLSINNSRYYLVEFGFNFKFKYMDDLLSKVIDTGKVPVVAHPERYESIYKEPWHVELWLDMGCLIQINKDSIMGKFGKKPAKAAWYLLDNNYVTCVASDAHSDKMRTTDMEEVLIKLQNEYGKKYAIKLLQDNPYAIINDVDIRRKNA